MRYLYIDDLRSPQTNKPWEIVRNFDEAIEYFEVMGCPHYVSLDHDLGDNIPSGYDIAKWMVEKDIEMNGKFIPLNFEFNVHSANPVGAANINGLFSNYFKHKNS